MTAKRHVLIVTLAVCAAALVAPLSLAGGSTAGEPESSATGVLLEQWPPVAPPTSSDPRGDVEQVEQPPQETGTAESATEDVAEEPEPSASTSEETVFPHPRCRTALKVDYIAPAPVGGEDVAEEPDPGPEAATTADDPSADGATDEPAAYDGTTDDGALNDGTDAGDGTADEPAAEDDAANASHA